MSDEQADVVVVGGGIHGAGVAQAAAAAGHDVLLLEERAVAAGTSSRSSKLIHGGLRYLESGQIGLVHESLSERAILCRIAPGLVRLIPFFIPIYRDTGRGPWTIRAGLSLYALLGHLRRDARFAAVPRRAWGELDGLRTDGLRAVFRYHDGQTDDAALTRAVLRSAVDLGARAVCPGSFLEARRAEPGWSVRYAAGEDERACRCRVLVNAAGPWIEAVRARIRPALPGLAVDLVAGSHVELSGELSRGIYYAEAPVDRRAVFVMPWKGHTLVGTTERLYTGDPARVEPTAEEIAYLEATLAHYFPGRDGRRLDAWAGLRVLPRGSGAAFDRPRETTLVADDEARPSAVGIYGGKLTGYRATAAKVMRLLARTLPARPARADTRTLALPADGAR